MMVTSTQSPPARPSAKSRDYFVGILRRQVAAAKLATDQKMLVVGATESDAQALLAAGFTRFVLSSLEDGERGEPGAGWESIPGVNVQHLPFAEGAYDAVFAHEVLHHCRQPHAALCEMLRVARSYVLFLEPHDSWLMRLLVAARFSFPFELPAVVDNDYVRGGVMDSCIPNFIFRWDEHKVRETISSFLPEELVRVSACPYWDFSARERDLELRKQTRLGQLARLTGGTGNLLGGLQLMQRIANLIPPLRRQGNKFLCLVEKTGKLRPWLKREDGGVVFNRGFQEDGNHRA